MIEKLIEEERILRADLKDNLNKQRDYYTIQFLNKHNIKFGDTIKFQDGRNEITGVFSKIEYSGVRPNWVLVNLFNSDGKVGKREKRCWNPKTITKIS